MAEVQEFEKILAKDSERIAARVARIAKSKGGRVFQQTFEEAMNTRYAFNEKILRGMRSIERVVLEPLRGGYKDTGIITA